MTTFNDLDFGPSHAWLKTRVGQATGTALIEGSRTATWARGRTLEEQPVDLYVNPWQGYGSSAAANTRQALLYLLRQLEELAGNPDLQPVYIRWSTTAFPGAFTADEAHDGWYVVNLIQPPYRKYVVTGGNVTVPITVAMVAPGFPASLALGWSGALLGTTYTGGVSPAGVVLGAYPVGSTAPLGAFSRTGAEGAIPLSANIPSASPSPLPFVRPPTVAGLWTGGVRVLDTVVQGGNAIPTNGAFLNANWVQVYGTQHDFTGDCVVTNGLLLLLFQTGQVGVQVWVWNTKLSTPAWQQVGTVRYLDGNSAAGTLREINLERVGWERSVIRANFASSGGQWARQVWNLRRGHYHASIDFWPVTSLNSNRLGLDLLLSLTSKFAWNDSNAYDMAGGSFNLPATTQYGYGAVAATASANSPLVGLLYQNPPSGSPVGQPSVNSTTEIGAGDGSGPGLLSFRTYGVFAVPFTTAPNLGAEGESGALGTGWSSVADAGASSGNTAKAASGTASGNADLFGTAWQPQPANGGGADVWFRVKVTSNAGSAAEMTLGLWDATASAFVTNGSTTLRANQLAASGTYQFLKVNTSLMLLPIGHNIQFRAVTAGGSPLGTDWFIDVAFLAPTTSASAGNIGSGDWPADIWAQFMQPLTTEWVEG